MNNEILENLWKRNSAFITNHSWREIGTQSWRHEEYSHMSRFFFRSLTFFTLLKIALKYLRGLCFIDSLEKKFLIIGMAWNNRDYNDNHQELAAIEADKQRLLDKVKNLKID